MVRVAQARRVQTETWADYVEAVFGRAPIFTGAVRQAIEASRYFEAARQVWGLGEDHRRAARRLLLLAVVDASA